MDRGERREVSKRKWMSRVKKIYESILYKNRYVSVNGVKTNNIKSKSSKRQCESITDFLDNSKYAKILKNTTVIKSFISDKLDTKIKNRKDRHNSKKILKSYTNE